MNRKNFYKAVHKFSFLLLIIISSFNLSLYAQDTVSAKYFPLAVGNVWYNKTYSYLMFVLYDSMNVRTEITKDTIINGKKYFRFSNYWRRYDSTTSNLLMYSPGQGCSIYPDDKIIDSLASRKNDILYCSYMSVLTHTCTDTGFTNIFGSNNVKTKSFFYDGLVAYDATYAMNFGVIFSGYLGISGTGNLTYLRGCKINGIVFGDTILSIVKKISSLVPERYILYQNYPNPFNPSTKIKFDIPKSSYVKLIVYDVLGREIKTLVNEKLNAGRYEVDWDGSDYPSGVYIYKLHTSDFVAVKKMLLTK
ncbi:T9SS type A sorting domain-containing protein [Bacteroidota bacterium]